MRRYLLIVVLLTLAVCIVAGAAYADIPDRIRDQQARINQGIRSGALTRSEADVLQDNLTWIRETFSRMKADGSLTPAERARLDQMLERNSQMIYNKKNNPIGRVYPAAQGAVVGDFQERIRDQQARINQGIRSGALTRSEADILLDNLDWMRDRFQRMKADGRLTVEEQQRLDQMLDRNSQMIYNKKNNPIGRVYPAAQRAVVGDFQERIRDQRERIEQGIRSGALTRSEADILLDNLDRIRDRFSRMKADGRFTLEEQARVDRLLDENDRMIRNKKHNAARRLDW